MQPTAQKIDQLQVTRDTLTSRGGLTFLVKYVEAIGILTLLLNRFAKIKKSVKGVSVGNLFLQALYFFFDGTRLHLCHFDELQRDQGYRAVVEMPEEQMASSHTIKRFFRAFNIFHAAAFRWVLKAAAWDWMANLVRQCNTKASEPPLAKIRFVTLVFRKI